MITAVLIYFLPCFAGFSAAAFLPRWWPILAIVVGLVLLFVPTALLVLAAPDGMVFYALPAFGLGLSLGGVFKLLKPVFDRLKPETILHG